MNQSRINREIKTVKVMIEMYCAAHHNPKKGTLCAGCEALDSYCMERISKCPFIKDKPSCKKCPKHCYRPAEREQVRVIMRYAGPGMLFSHPVLTFFHIVDGFRTVKSLPKDSRQG